MNICYRAHTVQGTNDLSTLSKCSMAKLGYFPDNFLHHFVAKECRRSPLIHRGYFIRTYVIDYLLKEFLKRANSAGKQHQIISLGAGFDSAFFRLKSQGLIENCTFYEVDFPQVVKRKANIIQQIPELKELIGNTICTNSIDFAEIFQDDYRLLGVDLTQVDSLDNVFHQAGIDVSCPTLILSECVLTYLTPQHSDAVIQWAAKTFPNAIFIDYEQINPNTAFGLFMQRHFANTGSLLKCINTYPSIQSHKERFLKLGWSFCESSDMNDAYANVISKEKKEELEQMELFDEFEEWHLKCSHYMILCAHKNMSDPYLNYTAGLNFQNRTVSLAAEISDITANPQISDDQINLLKRFGHSCILSFDRLLITLGGFGKENAKYQRVSNIVITNLETFETLSLPVPTNLPKSHFAQMYQSISLLTDNTIVLYGGRKSPQSASSAVTIIQIDKLERDINEPGDVQKEDSEGGTCSFEFNLGGVKSYKMNCQQLETKGDVPSPRWRHSCAVYKKNDFSMMFVYGGKDEHNTALNDGFILDLQTKHWTKVPLLGEIPSALHSHTCTFWKDAYLVLAGGLFQESIPSQEIYLIDVGSFTFQKLKISGTLYPRYSHTAHIIEDHLFLVGGVNLLHFSPGIAVINLLTGFSQEFILPVQDKTDDKIQMLHGHQSILFDNDQLAVIGGGGNCFSFGTHINKAVTLINLKQFHSKIKLCEGNEK